MLDFLKSFFSKDASEISTTETIFIFIGVLVAIVVFTLITRFCLRMERASGKKAHSLIKIVMIAAAPTIFSVLTLLDVSVSFGWFGALTVALIIAAAVWNVFTYGIFGGMMFSLMHIAFGLLASAGIVVFVFIAIAAIVTALFSGGGTESDTGTDEAPEYVIDPETNDVIYVRPGINGTLYLGDSSNALRKGSYANEYIDSNGKRYIR